MTKIAPRRRARRRTAAREAAAASAIGDEMKAAEASDPKSHPIRDTFVGQHYKAWRQGPDAANFPGSELGCYAAYNDIEGDVVAQLRAWETAGFP